MTEAPTEVVRQLYTLPPGRFVAVRTDAVATARSTDPAAARAIAGLRKPTVAAWLVNLLAWHRADLVGGLVELAGELRAAQRDLQGSALRELSGRRRALIEALVAEARTLAVEQDPATAAGKLPLAEVEATLSASLADESIAAQVRSGRLIRAVDYAGFGEVPRPRLRLVGPDDEVAPAPAASDRSRAEQAAPSTSRAEQGPPGTSRAEQARAERAQRELDRRRDRLTAELDTARADQRAAQADVARAAAAEHDAAEAVAEAQRTVAEWERRRSAAEQELARRKVARKTAERAATAARRYVGDVQAALEDLSGQGPDR
ncbi:hypothetical protein O7632_27895 [Solwaraspora sp. WMMD406]|uniref:hypothetical protein n=1 Tax=Solwaraspora sp. WMMD406 TaxID=3016095 RepID=UPI002415A3CE|nr:hypothetical protein [Solwaraspora sp. WMMD406]MDG4767888.1 hypothetical protein [Solwaraspora sp. WMMD406]